MEQCSVRTWACGRIRARAPCLNMEESGGSGFPNIVPPMLLVSSHPHDQLLHQDHGQSTDQIVICLVNLSCHI
jgi:hypothetical protein